MERDGLVLLATASVVVLVLCGVAAGVLAERWVRARGVAAAERRLGDELGTRALALTVDRRPLLPSLLRRPGVPVELRASDVRVGDDGLLRELHTSVADVHIDVRRRVLTTGPGTFVATIEERELASLVRLPSVVSRLELHGEGLRVWTVLGIGVDAEVLVLDGALRVVPDPVQIAPILRLPGVGAFRRMIEGAGLRLELPPLPFGAIVEELSFTTGAVVATGRLAPQQHRLRARADG